MQFMREGPAGQEIFSGQEFVSAVMPADGWSVKSTARTTHFETALTDISRQIKDSYYLKCCFTCQYSDYSPYGSDDYGTMLCYRRHKSDCLRVHDIVSKVEKWQNAIFQPAGPWACRCAKRTFTDL